MNRFRKFEPTLIVSMVLNLILIQERRVKAMAPSDLELEAIEADRARAARAKAQRDEENDAVKKMNQLMLYAKCVAVRDKQIEEKVCCSSCHKFTYPVPNSLCL